jgi:hypothetical protein
MTEFAEGLVVQYKDHIGKIRFVCNSYLTLCISEFPEEKRRDVCILIYRGEFNQIKLLKESTK